MKKHHFLILVVLDIFLYACSTNKEIIQVVHRNFTDQIQTRQNIVMTFDKNIAPDSVQGKWSNQPYLKITPAIQGKFQWTSANVLTFSPLKGFRPSTNYKVELTPKITRLTTEKTVLGAVKSFQFHTPYIALEDQRITWTTNAQGHPQVAVNMAFNYPIDSEQLTQKVKLTLKDKPLDYKIETFKNKKWVRLIVNEPNHDLLGSELLNVQIDKGITPIGGSESTDDIQFEAEVPSKLNFDIANAYVESANDQTYIVVSTTQEIKTPLSSLKELIQVSPNVDFEIEPMTTGFIIKGNFRQGKQYRLKINKRLTGVFGESLKQDKIQYVLFGKIDPTIKIEHNRSIYLTSKGKKNVSLRIKNIDKFTVSIFKVYENNIVHYMRTNYYHLDHDTEYSSDPTDYGSLVYEKVYQTTDLPKNGNSRILNLDFPDNDPFKGFYMLKVNSDQHQWVQDYRVISMSDIGFIVKSTKDDILVFTNSILTADPLKNVNVRLMSSNNQEIEKTKTDEHGVARFKNFKQRFPDFEPDLIIGQQGNDFNFIKFSQNKVHTARYEVGGYRSNQAALKAFIYEERNLYRPGETMHFKTIIRDEKWGLVGKIPVKIQARLPNGRTFTTQKGILSEQGTFETSIKLPASGVTGSYEILVYSSNDILLNSKLISVEEFVPDRIKVNAELHQRQFRVGEKVTLSAQALNLFGTPASNRNYEVEMVLSRKRFSPKGFEKYNFDLVGKKDIDFERVIRDNRKTDAEGKITESFSILKKYTHLGVLQGKIYTTVFDESGRSVARRNNFDILTQNIFYGIGNFDHYVGAQKTLQIPLIAVNEKGEIAQNAEAEVQLVRLEWHNVLQRYNGNYRYVSRKKEKIISHQRITIAGKNTTFPVLPKISGEYEIRVRLPNTTQSYVKRSFYAYRYGSTTNSSFEVDKEGQIEIRSNQRKYAVGEEAEILFTTPFEGKILVTVEQNKVHQYFFIDTDKKTATLKLPITSEYLPNIYLSATLIKPADYSAIPITVAHGYQSIRVENLNHKMKVAIQAPEKSRSNRTQELIVRTNQPHSEVTVAVVDEGILQQKNYQTPNPYGFFFAKRALAVKSYDMYPRVFPEINLQRNFGSGAYNLNKRTNPLTNRRIKPVSFWSGTLKTDENGTAKYTIDIPQFSGDLRVMAVATKDATFGSTFTNIKVVDPVVVSTSVPLFLSPSDVSMIPVMLTNTTDNTLTGKVKISTTKNLTLKGDQKISVSIPAHSEKQVFFNLEAKNTVGLANIQTEVTALGEKFTEKIDLTIRPSTSLLKESSSGFIQVNNPTKLDFKNDFLPSSRSGKLVLSKSPSIELSEHIKYLVQYPHGCVEQTVSKAFPQLYFTALSKKVIAEEDQNTELDPNQNVQAAIRKLKTMQRWNGGLSYWPSGSTVSWWGSAYAAHFLIEAKRAGFDVDVKFMQDLMNYLSKKSKRKHLTKYKLINSSNQTIHPKVASKEIFYSLYVLALGGKQDVATMNYYASNEKLLAKDSRYLLALTYLIVGDKTAAHKLLPKQFEGEKTVTQLDGSFASYVRDMSISLNALIDTDAQNPQIPALARQLSKQIKMQKHLNTQERAFSLLALGKLAKKAQQTSTKAVIFVDGKKIADFDNQDLVLDQKVVGKNVEIKVSEGRLYFFRELEGLSTTGKYVEEDKLIKVRRTFYDRVGNPITNRAFKQNELIVVKINVQSVYSAGRIPNVVITDMLPAGLEIENSRIGTIAKQKWTEKSDKPQHFDFRNDRVNIFTDVSPTMKIFYYTVRAVSKGKFTQGPISADAMYDASYHSYHGARIVTVE